MISTRTRISRGPGRHDKGATWISYSDMMAALLLVFILTLVSSIYMLQTRTAEVDQQKIQLEDQNQQLLLQQQTLKNQEEALLDAQASLQMQQGQLESQQLTLAQQQQLLETAKAELVAKAEELAQAQLQLGDQQNRLDAATVLLNSQREALDAQQMKIDDLIGVRTKIIQELSTALSQANLRATVDRTTGDIVLDSAVFFDTAQSTIKDSGKALLNQFIPVYLSVLLRPEYKDYLGEIVIEGHTDTQGEYLMNLELSQQRALTVAKYCLEMTGLTDAQREYLREILTAKGKSYSNPVYNADGSVNMDQSRRVEFHFRLKDAEMIEEMARILSGE